VHAKLQQQQQQRCALTSAYHSTSVKNDRQKDRRTERNKDACRWWSEPCICTSSFSFGFSSSSSRRCLAPATATVPARPAGRESKSKRWEGSDDREKKKGHERERKKELGRSLGEARHAREAKGGAFRGQPNPDAMEAIDQAMDAWWGHAWGLAAIATQALCCSMPLASTGAATSKGYGAVLKLAPSAHAAALSIATLLPPRSITHHSVLKNYSLPSLSRMLRWVCLNYYWTSLWVKPGIEAAAAVVD